MRFDGLDPSLGTYTDIEVSLNRIKELLGGGASGDLGTGTPTSVAANASSVTILAANSDRNGIVIVNDSDKILYLLFQGAAASSTVYTYKMVPGATVEHFGQKVYKGEIRGIWAAGPTGAARITEFSA